MSPSAFTDESGKLDAEAVMRYLRRSRHANDLVAVRRPQAPALAKSMTKCVGLLDQWVTLSSRIAVAESGTDPDSVRGWGVTESSPARHIRASVEVSVAAFVASHSPSSTTWLDTNPDRNPWDWGLDFLQRSHFTIVDHLLAVAILLKDKTTVRSAVTAARSALEASARMVYILEESADEREKLRRVLNLRVEEMKESSNSRAGAGENADDEADIQEQIAFALELGYTLKHAYKPGRHFPPVFVDKDAVESEYSTAKIIDKVLPDVGRDMWRTVSAVAHSRRAPLFFPADFILPSQLRPTDRAKSIAWVTLPSILSTRAAYSLLGDFTGWDGGGWTDMLDALARHWAVAAGLRDNEIRQSLGLDI